MRVRRAGSEGYGSLPPHRRDYIREFPAQNTPRGTAHSMEGLLGESCRALGQHGLYLLWLGRVHQLSLSVVYEGLHIGLALHSLVTTGNRGQTVRLWVTSEMIKIMCETH